MTRANHEKLYFLLPEALPTQYVRALLGRVVVHKSRPTDNYGPDIKFDLTEVIPDLYEDPASFTDVQKVLGAAEGLNAKVALTKLLDVFHTSYSTTETVITAPRFRRYRMTRIPQKFSSLMENAKYAAEVFELMNNTEGDECLGLVTGLLTCHNYNITASHGKRSTSAARIAVPEEAIVAVGGSPGVDVQVAGGIDKAGYRGGTATADGEMVLAVSYHEINYGKRQHGSLPFSSLLSWMSKKAALNPVPIARGPIGGDLEGFFSTDIYKEDTARDTGLQYGGIPSEIEVNTAVDAYDFELCVE